jgi:hypothetical protein
MEIINSLINIMRTTIKRIMTALLLLVCLEGWGQGTTISGFSPPSGPVGTLVTITGTNLSSPTAFTIGGVSAIVVSNTGTTLVGMVMPGTTSGTVTITTISGSYTSSGNYTVTATAYPRVQQGNKLVGTVYYNSVNGQISQGAAVALSADGNTAIVGGPMDSNAIGAAWTYTRSGSIWTQQGAKLTSTNAANNRRSGFGCSVAISADGNTAAVGGSDDSSIGAVWIFTRTAGIWTQQGPKLVGTGEVGINIHFGGRLSLSADGNTLAVGGLGDNGGTGAVWLFTRSGNLWAQQGPKLLGSGAIGSASQGTVCLSADGNNLIIGGPQDSSGFGAAWIFTHTGSTWIQQGNKLVGTGSTTNSIQGLSVAISADGNTAMVGGPHDSIGSIGIGAAWLYTRSGNIWTQQGPKLVGTGGSGSDVNQGFSVALSADGHTAISGAFGDSLATGATWVFTNNGSTWTQQGAKLVGTGITGVYSSTQGLAVSLSADGSTALIGGETDGNEVGAAWIFSNLTTSSSAGPDQTLSCVITPGGTATMAATGAGTWYAQPGNPGTATITTPASATTTITGFSAAGTYDFIYANGTLSDTMKVTVTGKPNAGPDMSVTCAVLPGGSATMAAIYVGTWTAQSNNPGTSVIGSPTDPTTPITGFSASGTYYYIWTDPNGCTDTARIFVLGKPDAGADQTTCQTGSATMAATGTGTWSAIASNPGTATILSPLSPTTTIHTFSTIGTYQFIWNNGSCNDTAAVIVRSCTSAAGPDQTICVNTTATMAATGTGTWTALPGNPATVTIDTPALATTHISGFTVQGTYRFKWGIATGDTMSVTVNPSNTPTVGINGHMTICSGVIDTFTSIVLDGGSSPAYQWYKNGAVVGSNSSTYIAAGLANYDIIWLSVTAGLSCAAVNFATSQQHTITVKPVPASPVLSAHGGSCAGTDTLSLTNINADASIIWTSGGLAVDTAYSTPSPYTVAGGNGYGVAAFQFQSPIGIYVDNGGNTYVADELNNRIQKFPAGSTSATNGVTIAGNGPGNLADTSGAQLYQPSDVFVDRNGYVYVADFLNHRIQKFPPGSNSSTYATTVAGHPLWAGQSSPIQNPQGIFVDTAGNVYVTDEGLNRVRKFPAGSNEFTPGTTVGGFFGGTFGSALNQLQGPAGIVVDAAGYIYVSDQDNHRVIKFPPGGDSTTNGTIVAGGNGAGSHPDQLNGPYSICLDQAGNLYVGDVSNYRVQKFPPGSTSSTPGTTVVGFYGTGSAANQIGSSFGLFVDSIGNIYVSDQSNNRIQKFPKTSLDSIYVPATANTYQGIATNQYGCATSSNAIVITSCTSAAGPDQTICVNTTATMAATGTGTWTALPGNPAAATIAAPASATTAITGFTTAGVYGLVWTVGGVPDTMNVTVHPSTVVLDAGPDYIDCGPITVYTVIFNGTVSGGTPPYNFIWTDSNGIAFTSFGNTDSVFTPVGGGPMANQYYLTAIDSNGCVSNKDSVRSVHSILTVVTDSISNVSCGGSHDGSIAIHGSSIGTSYSYTWSNSSTASALDSLSPGLYCYTVTDNWGCRSTGCDSIALNVCTPDTVWPGDADHNKFVDNNDLLTLGLGYDSAGPARTVQTIVWQADAATDWPHFFTIYSPATNFVHADCNGDGIIDANDTVAILTNFGDIHSKTGGYPGAPRVSTPWLYLEMSRDTVLNGDTLRVDILLGDTAAPVRNIYGLAFTYHYDPIVVDSTSTSFAFATSSWLGTPANSININRNSVSTGIVKAAITGINHLGRRGGGKIASFICVITTGNVNGKNLSYYTNLHYISDINAIDQYGNPVPLNAGIDSNHVGYTPNGIRDIYTATSIHIYPNPAHDQVMVSSESAMTEIRISDMLGKDVSTLTVTGHHKESIDISQLDAGVYLVHVSTLTGTATAKLIVNR